MARILRGEIYWADLPTGKGREQEGRRPILVISNDLINRYSETVIALAITSKPQRAAYPLTFKIASISLPKPSWVKLSQIRTISIERLGKCIGKIGEKELSEIIEGVTALIN